jgi:hypothetical protein
MNRVIGGKGVGRVTVDFEVANYLDVGNAAEGRLDPVKVRRMVIPGVVDSGATRLVLPLGVARQLGLKSAGKTGVTYADGKRAERDKAEGVYVVLLGRGGTFQATLEPRRRTALIGAIVLEDLDLLIDCKQQRLVPRDPRQEVHEIE